MKTEERDEGTIRVSDEDPKRLETYLPTKNVQNHAANLLPLSNGDLLCVWFSGTQEGLSDISIYMSRLKKGESGWSAAQKMSDNPERSEQNPVLFAKPGGDLWLFWTSQESGNQDSAVVKRRISPDLGENWGQVETFLAAPGTFVRQPIIVTQADEWLLPVFYCVPVPGRKWVGDRDYSAVKISSDRGRSWKEVVVPESTGCVHMNIVPLTDGTLVAFFRSRWADNVYVSRSSDGGHTWDPVRATQLPNNNSSIQATTLLNGHLAIVFNNINGEGITERRTSLYDDIGEESTSDSEPVADDSSGGKSAFWGVPRAPLTLAISEDGGRTWPYMKDLEVGDGYCMTNNSKDAINREYSYPSIKQTPDGKLHIAYTYFRQTIKYVCIDEEWVRE